MNIKPFKWLFFFLFLTITAGAYSQEKDSAKMLPPITITSTASVNAKVSSAFEKYFKGAVDPRWYKLNKNYLVQFIKEDTKNHALFDKKGYLIYHISYGTEANLPEDVKSLIQNTYSDYNITRAVNVKEGGRNIWVVNLEGLKKMVMVRVEEGELEEVGNYAKSI